MALLVVLLLISVTLGLSYAAVRSQYTAVRIQQNSDCRISARGAAVTGLTMAVKKMHTSGWAGVDSTLTGSLGSYENFQVSYTAGDPSLSADDADYGELPYRVTLLATGYAADRDNPSSIATHQIRAVVRLVPRDLADEPTDWWRMQNYTVYQTKKDSFEIDIPCRLEGPVRVQGQLELAKHYPNDSDAWWRYSADLSEMRWAGYPDYRPLTGPVRLRIVEQAWKYYYCLTNTLGVNVIDTPLIEAASDWAKPTSLSSYQLYRGGPIYTIPAAAGTLENVTLEPDPLTNPLGIYYRDTTITITGNVTVRGSLFCKDDIRIEGSDVRFEPVDLPGLYGSEGPLRLPTASCRSFFVEPTAGGSLEGLVAVFDTLEIKKSPETVEFGITGRVVTRKLYIKERQPWEALNWHDYHEQFEDEIDDAGGTVTPYFPVWMGDRGRNPKPLLTIRPDPGPITYHWHYPGDRIYEPHPDDDGLRWELLELTENP